MENRLLEEFRVAARDRGNLRDAGDWKASDAAHRRLLNVLERMRALGDKGEVLLRQLSRDADKSVRLSAATYLLPLDEESAFEVLEELRSEPPWVGFEARMNLQEWRAGRMRLP